MALRLDREKSIFYLLKAAKLNFNGNKSGKTVFLPIKKNYINLRDGEKRKKIEIEKRRKRQTNARHPSMTTDYPTILFFFTFYEFFFF